MGTIQLKEILMKRLTKLTVLLTVLAITPTFAKEKMGAGSSGGGDSYVLDFIKTANLYVLPWLKKNENSMDFVIDEAAFKEAVNPREILSIDQVFESCDGSQKGREVEACFNAKTGLTYLSRTRYRLGDYSNAKLGFVAHEVFRKMGIEGDNYEVTKKLKESMTLDNSKDVLPGNYSAIGPMCDVHLEVNQAQTEKEFIVTFLDKVEWVSGRPRRCPYLGKTWIFPYNNDLDIYISDALIEFKPLSDGNFILLDIPMSSGQNKDFKFIQK